MGPAIEILRRNALPAAAVIVIAVLFISLVRPGAAVYTGSTTGDAGETGTPYIPSFKLHTFSSGVNAHENTGEAEPAAAAAFAAMQVGYEESGDDYVISAGGEHKGRTVYGEWYGDPYGDWCAMFAAYCLYSTGTADVPVSSGCTTWVRLLSDEGCGLYRRAGDYEPMSGDLIFFDPDCDGCADHVGIVYDVSHGVVTTVEGNSSDSVCFQTYQAGDRAIAGYGTLSRA